MNRFVKHNPSRKTARAITGFEPGGTPAIPSTYAILNVPRTSCDWRLEPWPALVLGVLGSLLYTLGIALFVTRRPRLWPRVFSYHEMFHIVVSGSGAHYPMTLWYVAPSPRRRSSGGADGTRTRSVVNNSGHPFGVCRSLPDLAAARWAPSAEVTSAMVPERAEGSARRRRWNLRSKVVELGPAALIEPPSAPARATGTSPDVPAKRL